MTEERKLRSFTGKRRTLIIIASLGVLIYMAGALATDASRLNDALLQLGWLGAGGVLGLSLLNYGLRFQRWTLFLAALGHRLPAGRHLLVYLSGFAFTVSPAKAGEAVRALYLREQGVRYSESMAALFLERLLDLLAVTLLACLVLIDRLSYWPLLAGAAAVMIAVLLLIGQPVLPRWLERWAARYNGGRIALTLNGAANLLRSSRRMLKPRLLLGGLVLGVTAWAAEGLGFHLICIGLQFDPGAMSAIGIYSVAALAGGLAFFLPGGIGGMEVVMTGLLVARGATLPVALIATLLCRLATLWFAVLIGLVAAAMLEGRARPVNVASVP